MLLTARITNPRQVPMTMGSIIGAIFCGVVMLALASCGDDNKLLESNAPLEISGIAVLGPIAGAQVVVFDEDDELLGTDISGIDGRYGPIVLPNDHTGLLRVEVRPLADSTFICDYTGGCANGDNWIAFGGLVPYRSTLMAVVDSTDIPAVEDVNVTPFTTAMVARLEALGGLTLDNFRQANGEIAHALSRLLGIDLPAQITTLTAIDLNSPPENASAAEVTMAMANAGLISLIDPSGDLSTMDAVIKSLAVAFAEKGLFAVNENFHSGAIGAHELLAGTRQAISEFKDTQPLLEVLSAGVMETLNAALITIPKADAGDDQTQVVDGLVILDGSGSAANNGNTGGGLAFSWTQISGPPINLVGGTTARPSFIAPEAASELVFQLVVNNGVNESLASTITVNHQGNLPEPGRTLENTYNAANRLATTRVNGTPTHYRYNALGQRTRKNTSAGEVNYIYNEAGQLMGEYDAQGNAIVEYVWFNGQPLAQVRNQDIYWYQNDHLGAPRILTDKNRDVVWEANYTPFGKATVTTAKVENNLRFPGQYYDQETELHYNGYRYYDPERGAYPTPDPRGILLDFSDPQRQVALQMGLPIPDSRNVGINHLYGYADQNPLLYIDPTGEGITETVAITGFFTCFVLYALINGTESCEDKFPNRHEPLHPDYKEYQKCIAYVGEVATRGAAIGTDPVGTASGAVGEAVACLDDEGKKLCD